MAHGCAAWPLWRFRAASWSRRRWDKGASLSLLQPRCVLSRFSFSRSRSRQQTNFFPALGHESPRASDPARPSAGPRTYRSLGRCGLSVRERTNDQLRPSQATRAWSLYFFAIPPRRPARKCPHGGNKTIAQRRASVLSTSCIDVLSSSNGQQAFVSAASSTFHASIMSTSHHCPPFTIAARLLSVSVQSALPVSSWIEKP